MAISLTQISSLSGSGSGTTFRFKRVNDAVKGVISRTSMHTDSKGKTALIIELAVSNARGGLVSTVTDADGLEQIKVADFPVGEVATVWMNQGWGIGAIADALRTADVGELRDGGTLTIKLVEKRDVGKESPANIFHAVYEPPVGGTSIDELDSF